MKRRASLGLSLSIVLGLAPACREDAFCLVCDDSTGGTGADSSTGGGLVDGAVVDGSSVDGDDSGVDRNDASLPGECTPLGDEVCNELDDDCDGQIDESFDFTSNPLHCGGCDRVCQSENADTTCVVGECVIRGCLSGYADLDPSPEKPGCEYTCPRSPPVAEECNGSDDDCDGRVDEELVEPSAAGMCNRTPGTPCADVGLTCDTREGRTTWFCDYSSEVEFSPLVPNGITSRETLCDGQDNDCDGVADDEWSELGDACDDGALGDCADYGMVRCSDDHAATTCDLALGPAPLPGAGPSATEVCNNRDDNCDGIVDNSDPQDPKHIIDEMIHVVRGPLDYYIYKYEASRPDSSATNQGVTSARACSQSGVLPWSYVNYADALAACMVSGLRLCTAAEWLEACAGADARAYPYTVMAANYAANSCNGADHDVDPGTAGTIDNRAIPAGSLAICSSTSGVVDLSGNLKEWTNAPGTTSDGMMSSDIFVLRGGSYLSPRLGLTCQTELSQANESTILPNVGFRCCSDEPQ